MIFRCSSLGRLMTEPRSKGEVLSEGAKTYIEEVFNENELGLMPKEFYSKYTDKGILMEDDAIQFASDLLEWEFVTKNATRFTEFGITGEPDILTDKLLAEIKCSFTGDTYPLYDKELKNKSYYWQVMGYMLLTGMEQAEVVYCLMDTPEDIIKKEIYNAHWDMYPMWDGTEDERIIKLIMAKHTFTKVPDKLRVKRFIVQRDEKAIEKIKERVMVAREYYQTLKQIFN